MLIFFLFSSCCNSKSLESKSTKSTIIYYFPETVNKLLASEISNKKNDVYIYIKSTNEYYEAIICNFLDNSSNYYSKNTNRRVFIKGIFYPLIFDEDMIFGTTIDSSELIRQYKIDKNPLLKKSSIIAEGFFVRFKNNGEIISSGFGIAK